ncbi:MAG: cbb3-type cytochrome c oxidase subunit 3 [Bacteroidetes bacterium]|jgi:L-cystine uptake protein TcyP (sodium:dicarboxylate symporter family)|nr:cbb3-type cytochrome c oxidase subunit 3 [Bacteroidota bacterium]MBK8368658.1 cbb3-type cytochrome c oxidase subunit 3 [Bacteroidota bacterium]
MKFKNYLESITGIGIYPLISLIVFVVFFGLVTLYVIKGNKKHFEKLSNLPINDNETN